MGATAALLLWLAQLAADSNERHSDIPDEEQTGEPAPYPTDFEEQLRREPRLAISLLPEEQLPADLPWQNGQPAPPIGSPQARKGGTLRLSNVGPFPANFLAFGSPTPQFFHYNLFTNIDIPLVREHPATGQEIPGLAETWCRRGHSLFFRLQTKARYSNGRPVRARDFALGTLLRLRCGDCTIAQHINALKIYGDSTLEVILSHPHPAPELTISQLLRPAEPGFYRDFGQDYTQRYAQRIPPTTGAYTVTEVQRGRRIVLSRVAHWWAAELPGFRHTHNIDRIEHHFLTDEAQVWELFLRGGLDLVQTRNVTAWQSKLEGVAAAEDGRIVQHTLELKLPMPPYGIAFNTRTLPDLNLRKGLMHALDMPGAIATLFRGYAEQLPHFTTGYRRAPHTCPRYDFNPEKARAAFARAGYTKQGKDGILSKEDGSRLRVHFAYTPSDKLSTLATHLRQSAAACGAELVLQPQAWQHLDRQVSEGQHELIFWATMPGYPLPNYERFFHSSARGADAPFLLNDKEIDSAIETVQQSATAEQTAQAVAHLDRLIFERAIWLPGWMENQALIAAWQHVKLPTNYAGVYDVAESHQLRIEP